MSMAGLLDIAIFKVACATGVACMKLAGILIFVAVFVQVTRWLFLDATRHEVVKRGSVYQVDSLYQYHFYGLLLWEWWSTAGWIGEYSSGNYDFRTWHEARGYIYEKHESKKALPKPKSRFYYSKPR